MNQRLRTDGELVSWSLKRRACACLVLRCMNVSRVEDAMRCDDPSSSARAAGLRSRGFKAAFFFTVAATSSRRWPRLLLKATRGAASAARQVETNNRAA